MPSSTTTAEGLLPGFSDPVRDAQRIFRALLDAMAHPGRVQELPVPLQAPPPLGEAAAGAALTLLDFETPLWLQREAALPAVAAYLRFHCGMPLVEAPAEGHFALVLHPAEMPALEAFAAGSDECPHRSATLILQVAGLEAGTGLRLQGPGIAETARLQVDGLPPDFREQWDAQAALYPRGVDLILAAGRRLACLPRTTRVEA